MKLFAGTSNPELAQSIAEELGISLGLLDLTRFADQEVFVEIRENVRGVDVFVVQSTSMPANDRLVELLLVCDALRRGSARRITLVMPYYGYARQDRKSGPRTPISAKLVANLITVAGADRVLTLDLHTGQIQGFFDIPTDNLLAAPVFSVDLARTKGQWEGGDLVIVSPDIGGVVRARDLARRLGAGLAIIDKRREGPGVSEVMHVIGRVRDKQCVLVDDIVDSAGTLCNAAQALMEHGACSVRAYVTHGVFSAGALERIEGSAISELVTTDSIALGGGENRTKIRRLSVAPLLGEAIRRIAEDRSVSSLFG